VNKDKNAMKKPRINQGQEHLSNNNSAKWSTQHALTNDTMPNDIYSKQWPYNDYNQ